MEQKYRRCCGIDVHKKSVTVCVLAPAGKPETETKKRNFRTFTRDLKQLRAWLKSCKVTAIAMESTGQYWRAVWNKTVNPGGTNRKRPVNSPPGSLFSRLKRLESRKSPL